jgi:hypothetical protein
VKCMAQSLELAAESLSASINGNGNVGVRALMDLSLTGPVSMWLIPKYGDGVRDDFVEMTMICCQLLTVLVLILPFQKKNQDRKPNVGMTAAPFHSSAFARNTIAARTQSGPPPHILFYLVLPLDYIFLYLGWLVEPRQ